MGDCTSDGQGMCQKYGVKGYPTIKYFMSGDKRGKDYQGGRDFNALRQFAEQALNKPTCNAVTLKNCLPNELTFIEKNKDKTLEEINEEMAKKKDDLKVVKQE